MIPTFPIRVNSRAFVAQRLSLHSPTTFVPRCKLDAMSSTRLLISVLSVAALFGQPARHPLKLDDLARLRDVRDPQCSPDGQSVAYVVSQIDVKGDKNGGSHIWM